MRAAGRSVIFLDGDALRAVIAEDLGHSAVTGGDRRCAMRGCAGCWLARARRRLRDHLAVPRSAALESREHPGYREIYLRVPMDELRRRDSKGIYAEAQRGDVRDVVGLDVPAEAPGSAGPGLDNYGTLDVAAAVDRILAVCVWRDGAGAAGAGWPPSPLRPRQKLWRRWRRCCGTDAFLPQVRFSVAIGARSRPACSPRLRTPWGSESGHRA